MIVYNQTPTKDMNKKQNKMRKILYMFVPMMLLACGGQKSPQDGGHGIGIDSASIVVDDTLNTVEAVKMQVNAVYAYWNELRVHYDEGKPSVDDLFGSKEWQRVNNEVLAVDSVCECGGFFDFGDEGPLNPWVYDCYEGAISVDSIQVTMQPDGTADVRFQVKDAVTIKGVPMRWLMQVEDGQWRIANVFFVKDDNFDILTNMRAYAEDMANQKETEKETPADNIKLSDYAE